MSAAARRLPDFVIIGAQKAGTTWLGHRLHEQPGVFLPRPLEVHFFDRADLYRNGLDWYAAHFTDAPSDAIVGEKTPDYFWTMRPDGRGPNNIPARMHAALPSAKLIIVLRDPVKRAISALNHSIRARRLSPFVDPDAVLMHALVPAKDRLGLIGRGHYLEHLQRFLAFYPQDRVHVIFFEDHVVKAPQQTIQAIMGFLGRSSAVTVNPPSRPENRRMNSRLGLILNFYAPRFSPLISAVDRALPVAREITPSEKCRALLYEHYAPHNRALFDFLGRRASWPSA